MKKLTLILALTVVSIVASAGKIVTVKSTEIKEVQMLTVKEVTRYFVVLKNGKKYEFHHKGQYNAFISLSFEKESVTFKPLPNI